MIRKVYEDLQNEKSNPFRCNTHNSCRMQKNSEPRNINDIYGAVITYNICCFCYPGLFHKHHQ